MIKKGFFIFGLVIVAWFVGFVCFCKKINSYELDNKTQTDAIVVLTGGKNRIKIALDILSQGLAKKVFISGVDKDISIEDLKQRSDIQIDNNMPIVIGNTAKNTIENAIESKNWIEKNNIKSIRLVTSNYHLPRSILEFRAQNPNIKIIINPVYSENISPNCWSSYSTFSLILAEYNKFLYVFIRNLL